MPTAVHNAQVAKSRAFKVFASITVADDGTFTVVPKTDMTNTAVTVKETATDSVTIEITYGKTPLGDPCPAGVVGLTGCSVFQLTWTSGATTIETFKAPPFVEIPRATVTAPDTAWTGKPVHPRVRVYLGGDVSPTDYTVTYGTNTDIGNGTVTVTGVGDTYTGSKTVTFKIVPTSTKIYKTKVYKKVLKVYWKKVSAAQKITGYHVQYRVVGLNIWKTKTVSTKTSSTLTKLKGGTRYQIKVRACKAVDGAKYCGDWSKTVTQKVRR